jgi:hypothetical protein
MQHPVVHPHQVDARKDALTASDSLRAARQQRPGYLGARQRARYVRLTAPQVLAQRVRLGRRLN